MKIITKNNALRTIVLVAGLVISSVGNAWWHDGYRGGYYRGGYYHGYYQRGPVYYAPGVRYYAPACRSVRVCNAFGRCWIKRYCN